MARIDRALNIDDVAALARRRLPSGLYDFIDRGAEDEVTAALNAESIKRVLIRQKVGVDTSRRDIATSLYGVPQSMPIGLAVTGLVGMLAYKGEQAMGRAAAKARVPYTLGSGNFATLAEAKDICGDLLWRQLYPPRTPELLEHHLRLCREVDVSTLVITLDSPSVGNREYMQRNGFAPGMMNRSTVFDILRSPRWLFDTILPYMRDGGLPQFNDLPEGQRVLFGKRRSPASAPADFYSWENIREIRDKWNGRLVVKGVSIAEDAVIAADLGCDGVIVSNHGGRSLDGCIPSMGALPQVVDAVGDRLEVMVDGGFKRGADVLKAIAIGAKCVWIGRATVFGLAAAGEVGVSRALEIFRSEIHRAVAMMGASSINDLDRSFVEYPDAGVRRS